MPKPLSSSCQEIGLCSRHCPPPAKNPAETWSTPGWGTPKHPLTGMAKMHLLKAWCIFWFLVSILKYLENSNPSAASNEGPPPDAKFLAEKKGWNILTSWLWDQSRESDSHLREVSSRIGGGSDLWDLHVSFLRQADPKLFQTAPFCLELQIHLLEQEYNFTGHKSNYSSSTREKCPIFHGRELVKAQGYSLS